MSDEAKPEDYSLASSADPETINADVATPARKRRKRRKPKLPDKYRPYIDAARDNHTRRPVAQGVQVVSDGDCYTFEPGHRDLEAWEVAMCDAFGTRSGHTYWTFLNQLADLMPQERNPDADANGFRHWQPNETQLNAAINIVNGIRPKNEAEACLAAQMVAVHWLTMKVAGRAMTQSYPDPKTVAVASKLARTFTMQMDTLGRMRGRVGRQVIKVKKYEEHRHIHYSGDPGGGNNGTRADATKGRGVQKLGEPYRIEAVQHGEGSAVPGEDEGGRVVPFRRREG